MVKRLVMNLLPLTAVSLLVLGCGKQRGCNVFGSENYDPEAIVDDGSCVEMRDKFLGQYVVTSDCISGAYIRTISETSDRFIVEISAIGDTLGRVKARVSGVNLVLEPERQTVRSSVTVEGAGHFDEENGILDMSIRIRDSRTGTVVITNCLDRCVRN